MLTARVEPDRQAAPRLVPNLPENPADAARWRVELDELNGSLRELKSTDFAVRLYVELWLAFLAVSSAAKMLYDWHITHQKPPTVAFPILLLAVSLVADAVHQRILQRRMQRDEEARMTRQRELRGLLGLDEAPLPAASEPPQVALA